MVNDPIADFLTRIRNAQMRKKTEVAVPATKMLEAIAGILKEEGFVKGFRIDEAKPQDSLVIDLRYVDGEPAMRKLVRISKPGVRRYRGYREINRVMNGIGIAIFSTPKGVMTGDHAKKEKLGGEYLCEIW